MADVSTALPVLSLTGTAPALSPPSPVQIGLPLLRLRSDAPAVVSNGYEPRDVTTGVVYGIDGTTRVCALPNIRGVQWHDVLNGAGVATFEVPLEDATTPQLVDLRFVRLSWFRAGRWVASFTCRIRGESCELAVDGRRWVRFENMPGVASLLGDAVIFPEYGYIGAEEVDTFVGVNRTFATLQTGQDRNFGYMSAGGGAWYVDSDWVAPHTADWNTGVHGHSPAAFSTVDTAAKWISAYDPDVSQPSRAVNYFRSAFFTADPCDVQITCAGDDFLDLFVDGEQVITADRSTHMQWETAQQVTVRVSDGEHVIAARVANAPFVPGHANPVAFIAAVHLISATTGNPTTLLLDTNATDWLVNDGTPPPGWSRANVLKRLWAEAHVRGVLGAVTVDLGFTDAHDSDGLPWVDRGQFALPLATQTLADTAAQFAEPGGIDTDVDPVTLRWHAYRQQGQDRTATVELKLGDAGGTLKSWKTEVQGMRFSSVISQLADGEWVITDNQTAVDLGQRIESGVALGTITGHAAAAAVAGGMLDEAAAPLKTITGEPALVTPVPYVDYFKGDIVKVPDERNVGTMSARIVGILFDATGERVTVTPEYVEVR